MGFFDKLFGTKKPTADEVLATGELNWRLKSRILATQNHPNFLKFLRKLEDENDIQLGVHNDVADEMHTMLILRQIIYNKEGHFKYNFSIFFSFVPSLGGINFMGVISDFTNFEELKQPDKKYTISIFSDKLTDLSVEEYEKYYWELLNKSLAIRGLDPKSNSIRGKKCLHKTMEEMTRKKYT